MLKNALTVLALLFFANAFSASAQTVQQISSKITNNSVKLWIITAIDISMGGNACTKGEMWEFSSNGRVTISKCVKGSVRHEEKSWSLEKISIDLIMNVGGTPYVLKWIKKVGNKEKMKLRLKATAMTQQTKDITFTFERE